MRWLLLVCIGACSFQATDSDPDGPRDAAGMDADAPVAGSDAAIDAGPAPTCDLVPAAGSGSDRGKVGNSGGGGSFRWFACPTGLSIIGVGLDMSDQPVNGTDTISAHSIEIACDTLSVSGSDGGSDGSGLMVLPLDNGSNTGNGFTPATYTAVAMCPPGAFVSGMHVFSSIHVSNFLDGTIDCTLLAPDLTVAQTSAVPIVNSGSNDVLPTGADCAAGEQALGFLTDTGAGLDSFQLYCAPPTCD